jgi:AraC-like DNA-binding protein
VAQRHLPTRDESRSLRTLHAHDGLDRPREEHSLTTVEPFPHADRFVMTPLRSAEGHSVPAAFADHLVQLLRRWGLKPDDLLSRFGLTEGAVREPARRLPLSTWGGLLERARTLTGEPGLGFYLALQKRISGYGYLGFAAMSASSLGEALEIVARFSPILTTAVSLRLQVERRVASLVVEPHVDMGSVRDVALISLIFGMRQMGGMLTGRNIDSDAELIIPEPAYFPRFKHLMPRARFGQPVSRVVFDAANLDLPLLQADRTALELTRSQCERALNALGYRGYFVDRVRRAMWHQDRDGFRSLDEVAESLAVSARTLRRMLAEQRVSFSTLLDRERREKAIFLLKSSPVSLEEVAERLGYSTLSNFGRAFHHWTGTTPGAYRRMHGGSGFPPPPELPPAMAPIHPSRSSR